MKYKFINSDSLTKVFESYDIEQRTAILKESEMYDENSIIFIHDSECGNWIYAKGYLYGIDYNLQQLEEFINNHYEIITKYADDIKNIEDYTKYNIEDLSTKISTVEFDTQLHHQTIFNIAINENYDHTYSYEITNNYDQHLLEYNKQLCKLRNLQLISIEEFLYKLQYSITPVVNLNIYPYDSSSIHVDCVAILINYIFENSGEVGNSFGQKLHIFVQDGKYIVFTRKFDSNNLVFEDWQLISYESGGNVDPEIIDNINSSIVEIKTSFEHSRQYIINEFNNVNSSINDISARLNNLNLEYYAGQNISINDNNEITALGYIYDNDKKCFIEGDGNIIEWFDASNALGVDMRVDISGTAATTTYTYTGDSEKIQNFENNINYVQPYYDIYLKISSNRIAQYVSNSLDVENKTFNVVRSFDNNQDIHKEVLVQAGGKQPLNVDNVSIGAHIEGVFNAAHGEYSHVEGMFNTTYGNYAHAEGCDNTATGECSHAEGSLTNASGHNAHAEGYGTHALNTAAHAEGYDTEANNEYEHAEGFWNVSHKASDTYGNAGNTQHSIGIDGKNAFEVMQNGDMYVFGVGGYHGTDTKVQDDTIKTLQEYIASLEARIAALEGNAIS